MNLLHARILIVSRSTPIREQLGELLSSIGVIHIYEASDGLAALTLHQNGTFDLVVADWDVPHLSGLELLRAIRRGRTRSNTSMVLMTGEKSGARTIEALKSGANGLLELPLDAQRAREKLRRIIGAVPEHTNRGELRAADLWSSAERFS